MACLRKSRAHLRKWYPPNVSPLLSDCQQFSPLQCRLIIWYKITFPFEDISAHGRLMKYHMDMEGFYGVFFVTSKHLLGLILFILPWKALFANNNNRSLCYQMFLRSMVSNSKSTDISIAMRGTGYILRCWTALHNKSDWYWYYWLFAASYQFTKSSIWMIKLRRIRLEAYFAVWEI